MTVCPPEQGEASLKQALIKDKRNDNLFLLAASQTKDKSVLTTSGVGKMLQVKKLKSCAGLACCCCRGRDE
jgi:septum formation inhibitor-activating ATPase MinD